MTQVLASEERVRIAAGGLALAYLRLLSEGDTIRASQALRIFQSYWNTDGAPVVLDEPGELTASGAFDTTTYGAIYYAFQALGISGLDRVVTGSAADLPARYQRITLPAAAHPMWGAYHAAREASIVSAADRLRQWVSDFELGLEDDPSELTWLEDVVGYEGPRTTIVGTAQSSWLSTYWPWALGGALLLTAGAGLAYKMRGKRRR